ncbi:hypothetical protein M758_9G096400 [Ceratodon purpureus]|nr:hypothetical protein M758_9G096400 [Ceratodon purpureus]
MLTFACWKRTLVRQTWYYAPVAMSAYQLDSTTFLQDSPPASSCSLPSCPRPQLNLTPSDARIQMHRLRASTDSSTPCKAAVAKSSTQSWKFARPAAIKWKLARWQLPRVTYLHEN